MLERTCEVCGKIFKPWGANQKCCSRECSGIQNNNRRDAYMRNYRDTEKVQKKNNPRKKKSLDKAIAEARAQGLSYGQYKAREYLKERGLEDGRT